MQKILLVEDNFDNSTLVRLLLERNGFQVNAAENGAQGMLIAQKDKPNLILLDLDMPVMDGWTFIREFKADPDLREIPIVVVTAHLLPGERNLVIEAGCAGYVSKPFKVSDLLAEVRRCLL
ncbi:MAG TPA: two-component system response regulator [Chloroflexi bacterium]|nr:two-component system response regulator [Chloroflexota bacterium]HBY07573.1 two-component system response regulator [Chloroflexota bacterium]